MSILIDSAPIISISRIDDVQEFFLTSGKKTYKITYSNIKNSDSEAIKKKVAELASFCIDKMIFEKKEFKNLEIKSEGITYFKTNGSKEKHNKIFKQFDCKYYYSEVFNSSLRKYDIKNASNIKLFDGYVCNKEEEFFKIIKFLFNELFCSISDRRLSEDNDSINEEDSELIVPDESNYTTQQERHIDFNEDLDSIESSHQEQSKKEIGDKILRGIISPISSIIGLLTS